MCTVLWVNMASFISFGIFSYIFCYGRLCQAMFFCGLYITVWLHRVIKAVDFEIHSDLKKYWMCAFISKSGNRQLLTTITIGEVSNYNMHHPQDPLHTKGFKWRFCVYMLNCMNWFITFINTVLSTREVSNKIPSQEQDVNSYQTIGHWRDGRRGKVGLKGISEGHRGPLNKNKDYWCLP